MILHGHVIEVSFEFMERNSSTNLAILPGFGCHRYYSSSTVLSLLREHMFKEFFNFVGGRFSWKVPTFSDLMYVDIVVPEI